MDNNISDIEYTIADIGLAALALIIGLGILSALSETVRRWFEQFLAWLTSWHGGVPITAFMILFILLDMALVGFIVFTMRRYVQLVSTPLQKPVQAQLPSIIEEVNKNWNAIEMLLQSQNPSDWNMSVLRADALLDNALDSKGYAGATIAERLRIVDPGELPSLDHVWSAHRLRNAIAHDPVQQHPREIITHALNGYRKAFQELGIMQKISVTADTLPEDIFGER